MNIRSSQPRDLPALYRICLATGAAGGDATELYRDPLIVGHVYAAPYALFAPDFCFVAEDETGVGGYIVGAPDTAAFELRLESEWWPELRRVYPPPARSSGILRYDELMAHLIHHPFRTPQRISGAYPSHLHVNLLPRLQGRGGGRALMDRLLSGLRAHGSPGVHLAVGAANPRAVAFYRRCGYREIERSNAGSIIWFALAL